MVLPIAVGDLIDNTFVVEAIIGEGGMAVVARAAHTTYGYRVAIKLMLPAAASSPDMVKRFEQEQRTLNQLRSEHTVRIHGAGRHNNLPYMVLELLRGTDLAEHIKRNGPLDTDRAVLYMLQTCHAVAEAHSLGVVHRDLKPANLFLAHRHDGSPCVKVLDFGISKVTEKGRAQHDVSLTQTRVVMGSPFYMAPEQMLSARDADARSDIWALGVTMYELLSSSLPFAAQDTEAVCQRILHGDPTRLRKIRPLIASALEGAIMRCLRRSPKERHASVADFAQRLADFGPPHSRLALQSIYELVQPTQRSPHHSIADDVQVLTHTERNEDTTLYLQGSEASSGLGWLSAVLAVSAFALGGGLGWVLSLDTDPTGSRSALPPPPQEQKASRPEPEKETARESEPKGEEPIDLDEPDKPKTRAKTGAKTGANTVPRPSKPAPAPKPAALPQTVPPPPDSPEPKAKSAKAPQLPGNIEFD
jgi:serine/threonine protein kinase